MKSPTGRRNKTVATGNEVSPREINYRIGHGISSRKANVTNSPVNRKIVVTSAVSELESHSGEQKNRDGKKGVVEVGWWRRQGYPPDVYNRGGHPSKTLVLKTNYEGI